MTRGPGPRAIALSVAAILVASAARAEETATPLQLKVGPSGYEGRGRETLDQKVARRTRESEYLFRSICRGCLSTAAEAEVFGMRPTGVEIVIPEAPVPERPTPPERAR